MISDNCLHRSCLQLNKLSMQMVKLNSEWDMKVCLHACLDLSSLLMSTYKHHRGSWMNTRPHAFTSVYLPPLYGFFFTFCSLSMLSSHIDHHLHPVSSPNMLKLLWVSGGILGAGLKTHCSSYRRTETCSGFSEAKPACSSWIWMRVKCWLSL